LDKLKSRSEWARSALLTMGAQVGVQLLGFVGGIIVIRNLAPEEYAYYTIAITALGAMTALTDGGIGSGVLSQGGRVWQDRHKLGGVIAAGFELRKRFALVAIALSLPVTFLLLRHHGASAAEAAAVSVSIVPMFLATVAGQLFETVPRLHQRLLPVQRIQLGLNLARLATLALVLPFWPLAAVASLGAAIPQLWATWRLRDVASAQASLHEPPDVQARARIVEQVRRTLPATVYYTWSGQLAMWLISIFGRTDAVAAVGALGRLAMVLAALGVAFGVVAVPRYARIHASDHDRLRRRYWQAQGVLLAIGAVPLATLVAMPSTVLALLGPHYLDLEHEAALMAASTLMAVITGAAFSLGAARGVVAPPWLTVPCGLLVQAVLILTLPLDSLTGVIWLALLTEAGLWFLHVGYFTWAQRFRSGPISS
jgi:O-antigen/teichoic acid export membrane protein